ncbi:pLS20_p028 family conjugation system transmembrane protein [Streptococcus caprae]|uniref:PLS20_p028 family conjugation system transmembrane protein n=1 Tax=Streptococcus caprae TaxID=1640501 RepID=A0ABV8CXG4_9STRE
MIYDTYSDLVNDLEKGFLDINGKTNGNITGENAEKMASFYRYWSNYLEPTPAFLSFLAYIPGGIAKALYSITASLEHVFNNMFKLFGLFGYLGDNNTVIGQFFYWFQVIGTTLFSLILVVSAITGVFTKPVKYKGVITNFLLVTMVTAVLPLALTTVSAVMAQDAMNIQTISSEAPEGSKHYSSLAIQPMKNNVVDLKVLIDNDFSTELFHLDDQGYIKPPKEGSTPVNQITDSPDKRDTTNFATRIDFGATYGASNADLLDEMDDKQEGIKGLFLHKLNTNQDGVETITEHKIVGELNAFEPVYLRYKVNWMGMFMQYVILIVLLISMAIKLVKSVFDIIIQAMISPLQGYSSLSNSKKYKELLRTMGGALAGIFFEIVIMRVTLEILRDLPTLSVSAVTKLSGGFFDGLNMWEQCIAASLVYISVFLAAMQGVTMIERWLGVSTGHSDTAQQLIGAMMAGQAFATGAGAVGSLAMGAGQLGMDVASKAPGAIAAGTKKFGDSLAVTGGGLRGAFNAVRDQGVAGATKGGVSNMVDLADIMGKEAVGNVKNFAGGVADRLGQKEQAAHDAVYRGLKDHSLPEEPRPVSPFDPDALTGFDGPSDMSEDVGPSGGGISDPTVVPTEPSGEAFGGINEPIQTVTIEDESGTKMMPLHEWVGDTKPPKGGYKMYESAPDSLMKQPNIKESSHNHSESKTQSNFQHSMNQMHYMGQQMQQSAQRMQGQSHIRGAEIDESDE